MKKSPQRSYRGEVNDTPPWPYCCCFGSKLTQQLPWGVSRAFPHAGQPCSPGRVPEPSRPLWPAAEPAGMGRKKSQSRSVCEREKERVVIAHEGSKTLHNYAHAGRSMVLVRATDGVLTTSHGWGISSGFHLQMCKFLVICASSQEWISLFLTPLLYLISTGPTTVMATRAVSLWAITVKDLPWV